MPKTTAPYVIVYVTNPTNAGDPGEADAPTLCREICNTEEEAKARFGELAVQADGEILVFRSLPIIAEIETTPRVSFMTAHKPLDGERPKRKRRTRAEMADARANEAKKKNGAVEVVS